MTNKSYRTRDLKKRFSASCNIYVKLYIKLNMKNMCNFLTQLSLRLSNNHYKYKYIYYEFFRYEIFAVNKK